MSTRTMSLLEQKKQQWAREKEEMVGMCGIWGSLNSGHRSYDENMNRTSRSTIVNPVEYQPIDYNLSLAEDVHKGGWSPAALKQLTLTTIEERSHYLSSIQLTTHVCETNEGHQTYSDNSNKYHLYQRSPSLPPIAKQPNYEEDELDSRDQYCDAEEGETSGYASDSGGIHEYQQLESHTWNQKAESSQNCEWQSQQSSNFMNTPDSLNSSYSVEPSRPKWGDRGVGVGHLWIATPHNPDARLPQLNDTRGATPPAWLNRATNKLSDSPQVLVISHPEEILLNKEFSASCDTINTTEFMSRTFLRGQNVPLEPEILAEREKKRQKALEHQNAIRQQLEERERKRKEDKVRKLREEQLEEERLRRQQSLERRRLDEEDRRLKEKEAKEERKAKAMKEALEAAKRLAQEEKTKSLTKHISESNNLDESIQRVHIEDLPEDRPLIVKSCQQQADDNSLIIEQKPKEVETSKMIDEGTTSQLTLLLEPQEIPINQLSLIASPGRLLTPSKFRIQRGKEKATQTDHCCKPENSASHRLCKLPLRCRGQHAMARSEERPKWGVNKPETQYVKQSDRDPYYQLRLRRSFTRLRAKPLKQNCRGDSRSPSPMSNTKDFSRSTSDVSGISKSVSAKVITKSPGTQRIMQMHPSSGGIRKSSDKNTRHISIRGSLVAGNSNKQRIINSVQELKCFNSPSAREAEILSVTDVLNQLTALRQVQLAINFIEPIHRTVVEMATIIKLAHNIKLTKDY